MHAPPLKIATDSEHWYHGPVNAAPDVCAFAMVAPATLLPWARGPSAAYRAGLIGSKFEAFEVDIGSHIILTGPAAGKSFYEVNPKGNVPALVRAALPYVPPPLLCACSDASGCRAPRRPVTAASPAPQLPTHPSIAGLG